jgi:hypothetical protein
VSTTLYDRTVAFADRLADLAAPPARSREERAAYDAWASALKPRIARMRRRAERLGDPRRWEFDERRSPLHLHPAAWTLAVRELAGLYTELAGALAQYERFRIVWTPRTRFGIIRGAGRAVPAGSAKDRAKAKEAAKKALANAKKAKMADASRVLAEILVKLANTKADLRAAIEEVRHLTAALQLAEEDRLAKRVGRMAEGTKEREKAEDLLLKLAQGRLDAVRRRDAPASDWGMRLRTGWLRPRTRLVPLVEGP